MFLLSVPFLFYRDSISNVSDSPSHGIQRCCFSFLDKKQREKIPGINAMRLCNVVSVNVIYCLGRVVEIIVALSEGPTFPSHTSVG